MKSTSYLTLLLILTLLSHGEEYNTIDEERERIARMSFMKFAPKERKEAFQEVALAFYKATSIEKALELVHKKSLSETSVTRSFTGSLFPHNDAEAQAQPTIIIKPEYLYAEQILVRPSGETVRIILQWLPEEGKPKVDYDATFQVGEISWAEFLEEKTELPVKMRAVLQESDYYNGIYKEIYWQAYTMHGPELNEEKSYYLYIPRKSKGLELLQKVKRKKKHVIFSISYNPKSTYENQFQADEIHQINWLSDLGNL